jgi:hypothetical protein
LKEVTSLKKRETYDIGIRAYELRDKALGTALDAIAARLAVPLTAVEIA